MKTIHGPANLPLFLLATYLIPPREITPNFVVYTPRITRRSNRLFRTISEIFNKFIFRRIEKRKRREEEKRKKNPLLERHVSAFQREKVSRGIHAKNVAEESSHKLSRRGRGEEEERYIWKVERWGVVRNHPYARSNHEGGGLLLERWIPIAVRVMKFNNLPSPPVPVLQTIPINSSDKRNHERRSPTTKTFTAKKGRRSRCYSALQTQI